MTEFIQNRMFELEPEWTHNIETTLNALHEVKPTQLEGTEGVENLGGLILSHLQSMVAAPPYNGQNEDIVPQMKEFWEHDSGLVDRTVTIPYKTLLQNIGIWQDEVVRALVINSMNFSSGNQVYDIQYLNHALVKELPLNSRRYIHYLSESASEMTGTRLLAHYELASIHRLREKDGVLPVERKVWEQFKQTPQAKQLGEFSTVEWLARQRSYKYPRYIRYRNINVSGLQDYLNNPDYEAFVAEPNSSISKSLIDYISTARLRRSF